MKKIRLHWSLHPVKAAGLYLDATGKQRSPWYDEQCKDRHPLEIGQNLDIDFSGGDQAFFDLAVITRLEQEAQRPTYKGELEYNATTCAPVGWYEGGKRHLLLWMEMPTDSDGNLMPPRDRDYIFGIDISAGTGASNSVISIGDTKTMRKVGELAEAHMSPDQFAGYAIALAHWFKGKSGGARLIWEAAGPGIPFGQRVTALGYRNVFFREQETSLARKQSDCPGWYMTRALKHNLLQEYRRALGNEFQNPSKIAVTECREYIYWATGAIEHSRAMRTIDPTGSRANHGDRVIADALCWKLLQEYTVTPEPPKKEGPDKSTFKLRRDKRHEHAVNWW